MLSAEFINDRPYFRVKEVIGLYHFGDGMPVEHSFECKSAPPNTIRKAGRRSLRSANTWGWHARVNSTNLLLCRLETVFSSRYFPATTIGCSASHFSIPSSTYCSFVIRFS